MAEQGARSLWPLWSMVALALAPVLASTALYMWWTPASPRSIGLLQVRPLPAPLAAGWPAGKWVLLGEAGCGQPCRQRTAALQRIRTAQGEAAERLVVHAAPMASGWRRDGFYLVDPLRNVVMFYADGQSPTPVIREIGKVLKTNNGLG